MRRAEWTRKRAVPRRTDGQIRDAVAVEVPNARDGVPEQDTRTGRRGQGYIRHRVETGAPEIDAHHTGAVVRADGEVGVAVVVHVAHAGNGRAEEVIRRTRGIAEQREVGRVGHRWTAEMNVDASWGQRVMLGVDRDASNRDVAVAVAIDVADTSGGT